MPVVFQLLPGASDMNHFRFLRPASVIVVDASTSCAVEKGRHPSSNLGLLSVRFVYCILCGMYIRECAKLSLVVAAAFKNKTLRSVNNIKTAP